MDLLKDDVFVGPVLGLPDGDVALQGAKLGCFIAPRKSVDEEPKQGFGLQGRVVFQLFLYPGPVLLKGVGSRAPGVAGFGLAWPPFLFVFAGCAGAHAGRGGGLGLRLSFFSFLFHSVYLCIFTSC